MAIRFPSYRSESKKAATAEASDSEEDEPAPTSDIEVPDVDGSDKEEGESASKKKAAPAKKGKKRKGGVMIPDEWPWEEAKKIFVNPEVLPADEVEVNMGSLVSKIYSSKIMLSQLEWKNPDVEGLVQFLVTEKGFKYALSLIFLQTVIGFSVRNALRKAQRNYKNI